MSNLNYKINELDEIFYSTKESQGHDNALAAIKYVLFNDNSEFKGIKLESNKYLYISKTNNAREKAMHLQSDDLIHIIVKLAMASFGLRKKEFSITEDTFIMDLKRIKRLDISPYDSIELITFAAIHNINDVYSIIDSNKELYTNIVDYLLNERYTNKQSEILDNFSGIIDNNNMNSDERFKFYDTYNKIDEIFTEIKRNNPDYIK